MTYRLKTVKYKGRDCRILLQNENGPCPLLAAANALLLRGTITLPAHCVRNSVASLEDLTNMLANQAMLFASPSSSGVEGNADDDHSNHHYVDELLVHIPTFQFGMDVNPKFTQGVTGYEYTAQLTAFDMLRVKLVHGWLVDPQQEETYQAIGSDTYNALVEKVIYGHEASTELERLHHEMAELQVKADSMTSACDLLDDQNSSNVEQAGHADKLKELQQKCNHLGHAATKGSLITNFLESTGHQLTVYGLQVMYEELTNDELVAFFRNNHFCTMTKQDGILYLLVTDLGYANTPGIVWEKLDVIDGDTEYVNSDFKRAGEQSDASSLLPSGPTLTPEQLAAQSGQKESDYQLAWHLSKQPLGSSQTNTGNSGSKALDAQEGHLMAAATEASLRAFHGLSDGIKSFVNTTNNKQPKSAEETKTNSNSEPKKEIVAMGVPLGSPVGAGAGAVAAGTVAQLPPLAGAAAAATHAPAAMNSTVNHQAAALSHEEADKILAMQLQADDENHDEASMRLARQLQEQENRHAAVLRQQQPQQQRPQQRQTATTAGDDASGRCVIS